MADYHEISFEITEGGFSLEMKTAEMSVQLVEAQKKLFSDIVQVNYGIECVKFRYDCKKSLIPKKLMGIYIDHLNNSFDQFGKVMAEHQILQEGTDPCVTVSFEKKFILEGRTIFIPRFDKAVVG